MFEQLIMEHDQLCLSYRAPEHTLSVSVKLYLQVIFITSGCLLVSRHEGGFTVKDVLPQHLEENEKYDP